MWPITPTVIQHDLPARATSWEASTLRQKGGPSIHSLVPEVNRVHGGDMAPDQWGASIHQRFSPQLNLALSGLLCLRLDLAGTGL